MIVFIILCFVGCFALVVFVGPPYLPTLAPQVKTSLDMLDLQPGQTMIELGCGDGKVLLAAAKRGWKVVGIELNPLLVLLCKLRTWRYRQLVTVRWGNYWNLGLWPPAEAIFGFVLPKYMGKLDETIQVWQRRHDDRPVKLASFAFKIPGKPVVKEENGVFLYQYKRSKRL
jgi:SAM-dependent methyltransferase